MLVAWMKSPMKKINIYDELDIERYENIEDDDGKYEDIEETVLNQKAIVKVIEYLEIVE